MRLLMIGGAVNLGIVLSYICVKRFFQKGQGASNDEYVGYEAFSYPEYYKKTYRYRS